MQLESIQELHFPRDKAKIAMLNLDEKIFWYLNQNPQDMIFLGNSDEFETFWRWYYMVPLFFKRMLYYFKFW